MFPDKNQHFQVCTGRICPIVPSSVLVAPVHALLSRGRHRNFVPTASPNHSTGSWLASHPAVPIHKTEPALLHEKLTSLEFLNMCVSKKLPFPVTASADYITLVTNPLSFSLRLVHLFHGQTRQRTVHDDHLQSFLQRHSHIPQGPC